MRGVLARAAAGCIGLSASAHHARRACVEPDSPAPHDAAAMAALAHARQHASYCGHDHVQCRFGVDVGGDALRVTVETARFDERDNACVHQPGGSFVLVYSSSGVFQRTDLGE